MRIPFPVIALLALTVVCSVAPVFDDRMYDHLALVPEDVWRGEVWRLVTFVFVESGPYSLVVGCMATFYFGIRLCGAWGERRFVRYVVLVIGVAGAGTCLVSLVFPPASSLLYYAGLVLDSALTIAWALTFPDEQLRMYLVPLGGKPLAYGSAGLVVLFAVFFGVAPFLPELFACAVALVVMTPSLRARLGRFGGTVSGLGGPFSV